MKDALSPDQGRARNIFRVDGDHRTQSYNFSFVASEINAFDLMTGAFEGSIPINVGAGNTPGGLWGLTFGSGAGNGGNANTLYFNDGINGETGGLFGALMVPAPATLLLLGTDFVATTWRRTQEVALDASASSTGVRDTLDARRLFGQV